MKKEIIKIYKKREKAHQILLECDKELDKIIKYGSKELEEIYKELKKYENTK